MIARLVSGGQSGVDRAALNAAFENGVLLDDEDEFKAGRSEQVFHRVRFSVSQPTSHAEVSRGLAVIRRLLDEGRAGYERFD